ncbi:28279_t:CDS:2 [Dentiscutata erythropus]|uniref:28279_t:CDS:1 n=1 Tax=Dentiscutata erythropus TaxID=1348616 RepID=A0A9N9E5D9_9GLOM|nr:28279_t:CDS:2 [Dentiscutata erythropus]
MFVNTLVEGKIPVKDTTSKYNTISKHLFDKLESDHRLEGIVGDDLIGEEIKGLDLQFCYKGKDWLWICEAKINFGYFPKTCVRHAKIVIDGMSIPLIEENSNKASSNKNNLSHSETEIDKPDLNLEKFIDMFKKLSIETNLSSSDSESTGGINIEVFQRNDILLRYITASW